MATMTISLPNQIAKQIDAEAQKKGFATRSEFVRSLLRKYFTSELEIEEFKAVPLEKLRADLAQTGKYSEKFIDSVTKGLAKSSKYVR